MVDIESAVIYHPLVDESRIEGGVKVSAEQQRTAMDKANIKYTDEWSENCDIVHLNFPGPHAIRMLWRANRTNTPVITHVHSLGENIPGTYRFSGILGPIITRYFIWFYRQADYRIAVSEYTRNRLAAYGITQNVFTVSNGVDEETLAGNTQVGSANNKSDDQLTIVNLGQVYDIKGVGDFIEVGDELSHIDFKWYGPRHKYLSPRSTKQKVKHAPQNVEFPGYIEDKRQVFNLGDIFFAPTHRETQGMSILE
ncbi:MAG: glycosyltransferase family 4 protein, partial [Halobacteriaceae archaeon]